MLLHGSHMGLGYSALPLTRPQAPAFFVDDVAEPADIDPNNFRRLMVGNRAVFLRPFLGGCSRNGGHDNLDVPFDVARSALNANKASRLFNATNNRHCIRL